jgi:hypothetical protein
VVGWGNRSTTQDTSLRREKGNIVDPACYPASWRIDASEVKCS